MYMGNLVWTINLQAVFDVRDEQKTTVYTCSMLSSSKALVSFPDCTEGLGSRNETK